MKKILVVDDDVSILRLFDRLGTRHGWKVKVAAPEQDALAAIDTDSFDLAFLDVDLGGGMDGIALALKFRDCAPDLAIVMMSGDSAHAERAAAAGMGEMLAKPFEPSRISELVDSHGARK